MTTTTENNETKTKKAPPIGEAVLRKADGSLDFTKKVPIWASKNGKQPSFKVTEPGTYALMMRKPKSQPAAEGKGA